MALVQLQLPRHELFCSEKMRPQGRGGGGLYSVVMGGLPQREFVVFSNPDAGLLYATRIHPILLTVVPSRQIQQRLGSEKTFAEGKQVRGAQMHQTSLR